MTGAIPMLMASVGPVADAFAADKRLVTGIMGPVGSAKTTTCIRKCIHAALWQNRGPDGVRRARVGVIRDTYPQLKRTVLESWFGWFPKELGAWDGQSPLRHNLRINAGGAPLELEMVFTAIGDHKVEDVMRGWEMTAVWMNEADLLAQAVFRLGLTRIGRYPDAKLGGCAWRGIFMDLNAPDTDNWTYPLLAEGDMGLSKEEIVELRAEFGDAFGIGFHRQPGGRSKSPPPENIANLPKGYYSQMMIGQSADFIRRMVDNQFGAVRNGMPVYPEFKDALHVAAGPLKPVRGVPIDIGVDGGLTPAAAIGQQLADGQKIVLDELVIWIDQERQELERVGPTAFGEALAAKCLLEFPDNAVRFVWCDPATGAGEGARGNDRSWLQLFAKAFRKIHEDATVRRAPAKGNALEPRLEAIRTPLKGLVGDGEPEYLLSPKCKYNRRGKNSGYVYRRTALAGGDDRYQNEPVKNQFSHLQDAEQYLFCGWGGSSAEMRRATNVDLRRSAGGMRRGATRVVNDASYSMFGD